MGKNPPPQKEEIQKSSKNPPSSSKPPKSAAAKSTTPATTPQESKGTAQKVKADFTAPKTYPRNLNESSSSKKNLPESPATPLKPTDLSQNQKGDKRARDLSQNSKSSESSSAKPPPPKKLQSYAEAAKPADQPKSEPPSVELAWHSNQIRIYKGNRYHAPISFQDFIEIRDKLFSHTLNFMRANPSHKHRVQVLANYYHKHLKCGVFVCKHEQALAWIKEAVTTVSDSAYRGWTSKDEQVTAFVKIFVSQGFENLTPEDYLDANRLLFETTSTKGIPWTFINEYVHHQKHTRIIIAQIPLETFELIQAKGQETTEGSRVWKAEGFMAPLKMTLATAGDMRPTRPQNPPADPSNPERNRSRNRRKSGSGSQPQQGAGGSAEGQPPQPLTPPKTKMGSSPKSSPLPNPILGSSPMREDGMNDISVDPFLSNAQVDVELPDENPMEDNYDILGSASETEDMDDDFKVAA